MINKIGYACINLNLKPKSFKYCRINSMYKYGINYLRDKIINNLQLTKDILNWNIKNNIYMYRVTSKLLPLVTHPIIINDFNWNWKKDKEILNYISQIKDIVIKNNIRLSMHPDQFTVLNSLNNSVVKNSIIILNYHYELLKRLGGKDIIIHVGGVYNDKKSATERFIKVFNTLSTNLKNMIRLENDDTSYNIEDVLYISNKTNIPVVLDIHHHMCNNINNVNIKNKIINITKTWENINMIPKVHISSGKNNKLDKKHNNYVKKEDLKYLLYIMENINFDLMVEAKKKDEAVLQLQHIINN